jgi:hypothetical protein
MILSKSDHLRTLTFAALLLLTAGRRDSPSESVVCSESAYDVLWLPRCSMGIVILPRQAVVYSSDQTTLSPSGSLRPCGWL